MAEEAKLPTEEEIARLPRWARVAFAARCARRVLPLFARHWPEAPEEHVRAVVSAVEFAEDAATNANDAVTVDSIWAEEAADAANAAGIVVAAHVARAAAYAADNTSDDELHTVVATARAAAAAAGTWSFIRKDFQRILSFSRRNQWISDTPVPPSVFSSLDPGASSLVIELLAGPGVEPHVIGDAVVKLWEVANEYHMALGGGVLTFDEFKQMIPALVPVGPEVGG